jgi:hypothetical protein
MPIKRFKEYLTDPETQKVLQAGIEKLRNDPEFQKRLRELKEKGGTKVFDRLKKDGD